MFAPGNIGYAMVKRLDKWMNEKIYTARLKAYNSMLNLPRLSEK